VRFRVHEDGRWAVRIDDEPSPAQNWFVLAFGLDPWKREAEVLEGGWSEAVVLVPGLEAGARLAAALAAVYGVDEIDVSEPEMLADALHQLAEQAER